MKRLFYTVGFVVLIGLLSTTNVKAAALPDGSFTQPIETGNYSIMGWLSAQCDQIKNSGVVTSRKAAAGVLWEKYGLDRSDTTKDVYFIRVGGTGAPSSVNFAAKNEEASIRENLYTNIDYSMTGSVSLADKEDNSNLWVFWISKLKRADSATKPPSDEQMVWETSSSLTGWTISPGSGSSPYYNTFGYGIKSATVPNNADDSSKLYDTLSIDGKSKPLILWKGASHYKGYNSKNEVVSGAAQQCTKGYEGRIIDESSLGAEQSEWLYTRGGSNGYTVYAIKYSALVGTILDASDSDGDTTGFEKKYDEAKNEYYYELYLNGIPAIGSGDGWDDLRKTVSEIYTQVGHGWTVEKLSDPVATGHGSDPTVQTYSATNINRFLRVPIPSSEQKVTVRLWDITTNRVVQELVVADDKVKDYAIFTFDPAKIDADEDDGGYDKASSKALNWDPDGNNHDSIQYSLFTAFYKWGYVQGTNSNGNTAEGKVKKFANNGETLSNQKLYFRGAKDEAHAEALYKHKSGDDEDPLRYTLGQKLVPVGVRVFGDTLVDDVHDTVESKLQTTDPTDQTPGSLDSEKPKQGFNYKKSGKKTCQVLLELPEDKSYEDASLSIHVLHDTGLNTELKFPTASSKAYSIGTKERNSTTVAEKQLQNRIWYSNLKAVPSTNKKQIVSQFLSTAILDSKNISVGDVAVNKTSGSGGKVTVSDVANVIKATGKNGNATKVRKLSELKGNSILTSTAGDTLTRCVSKGDNAVIIDILVIEEEEEVNPSSTWNPNLLLASDNHFDTEQRIFNYDLSKENSYRINTSDELDDNGTTGISILQSVAKARGLSDEDFDALLVAPKQENEQSSSKVKKFSKGDGTFVEEGPQVAEGKKKAALTVLGWGYEESGDLVKTKQKITDDPDKAMNETLTFLADPEDSYIKYTLAGYTSVYSADPGSVDSFKLEDSDKYVEDSCAFGTTTWKNNLQRNSGSSSSATSNFRTDNKLQDNSASALNLWYVIKPPVIFAAWVWDESSSTLRCAQVVKGTNADSQLTQTGNIQSNYSNSRYTAFIKNDRQLGYYNAGDQFTVTVAPYAKYETVDNGTTSFPVKDANGNVQMHHEAHIDHWGPDNDVKIGPITIPAHSVPVFCSGCEEHMVPDTVEVDLGTTTSWCQLGGIELSQTSLSFYDGENKYVPTEGQKWTFDYEELNDYARNIHEIWVDYFYGGSDPQEGITGTTFYPTKIKNGKTVYGGGTSGSQPSYTDYVTSSNPLSGSCSSCYVQTTPGPVVKSTDLSPASRFDGLVETQYTLTMPKRSCIVNVFYGFTNTEPAEAQYRIMYWQEDPDHPGYYTSLYGAATQSDSILFGESEFSPKSIDEVELFYRGKIKSIGYTTQNEDDESLPFEYDGECFGLPWSSTSDYANSCSNGPNGTIPLTNLSVDSYTAGKASLHSGLRVARDQNRLVVHVVVSLADSSAYHTVVKFQAVDLEFGEWGEIEPNQSLEFMYTGSTSTFLIDKSDVGKHWTLGTDKGLDHNIRAHSYYRAYTFYVANEDWDWALGEFKINGEEHNNPDFDPIYNGFLDPEYYAYLTNKTTKSPVVTDAGQSELPSVGEGAVGTVKSEFGLNLAYPGGSSNDCRMISAVTGGGTYATYTNSAGEVVPYNTVTVVFMYSGDYGISIPWREELKVEVEKTVGLSSDDSVFIETDTVNSTSGYESDTAIPTSEYLRTYAKVRKYRNCYQILHITSTFHLWTWSLEKHYNIDETRSTPAGDETRYYIYHSGQKIEGEIREHTRSTDYYVMNYGHTYIPIDVSVYNDDVFALQPFGSENNASEYEKVVDRSVSSAEIKSLGSTVAEHTNGVVQMFRQTGSDIMIGFIRELRGGVKVPNIKLNKFNKSSICYDTSVAINEGNKFVDSTLKDQLVEWNEAGYIGRKGAKPQLHCCRNHTVGTTPNTKTKSTRKCEASKGGKHAIYENGTQGEWENLVSKAIGKQADWMSWNDTISFYDGKFTYELSNSKAHHTNVRNKIKEPPLSGCLPYGTGIESASSKSHDGKTAADGHKLLMCKSDDAFWAYALPIPTNVDNDTYESTAVVHYRPTAKYVTSYNTWKSAGYPEEELKSNIYTNTSDVDVSDVTVFTPVCVSGRLILDDKYVQKIDQNGASNVVMDTQFMIRVTDQGSMNFPGYQASNGGLMDYSKYLLKDVVYDVDDEGYYHQYLDHAVQVCFPFPVIRVFKYKNGVEDATQSALIPANTWQILPIGDTTFLASYFGDELELKNIIFRANAENSIENINEFSYAIPDLCGELADADGTAAVVYSTDGDEDESEAEVDIEGVEFDHRDVYEDGNILRVSEITNESSLQPQDVTAINWLACNLYGRIYGFKVIDQTDYPSWESFFRDSTNSVWNKSLNSGINNNKGQLELGKTFVMPSLKGDNPYCDTAGVLKPGYAIRYTFETVGDMEKSNSTVEIEPEFYWINQDGQNTGLVDIYYQEESSVNASSPLIKVGSLEDKNNYKATKLSDFDLAMKSNYTLTSSYTLSSSGKTQIGQAAKALALSSDRFLDDARENWTIDATVLRENLRTFDGIAHKTILTDGSDDFLALKGWYIDLLESGMLSDELEEAYSICSHDNIYQAVQEWYGEFYVPSVIYVTKKDTDISQYLKHGETSSDAIVTGTEPCWLQGGYLAVKFNIVTKQGDKRWLAYDNTKYGDEGSNAYMNYNTCDMWGIEGYQTSRTDSTGTTFDLTEGTAVLYQIGLLGRNKDPDVLIEKDSTKDVYRIEDGQIVYPITVTNTGSKTLYNVTVADWMTHTWDGEVTQLPSGVYANTSVATDKPVGAPNNFKFSVNLGTLAIGESKTFEYRVNIPSGITSDVHATNFVHVTTEIDPGEDPDNPPSTPPVTPPGGVVPGPTDDDDKPVIVVPESSIRVEKTSDKKIYTLGQKIIYRIEVTNTGDRDLSDVYVAEQPGQTWEAKWDTTLGDTGVYVNDVNNPVVYIDRLNIGATVTLFCVREVPADSENGELLPNTVKAEGRYYPDPNDPVTYENVVDWGERDVRVIIPPSITLIPPTSPKFPSAQNDYTSAGTH